MRSIRQPDGPAARLGQSTFVGPVSRDQKDSTRMVALGAECDPLSIRRPARQRGGVLRSSHELITVTSAATDLIDRSARSSCTLQRTATSTCWIASREPGLCVGLQTSAFGPTKRNSWPDASSDANARFTGPSTFPQELARRNGLDKQSPQSISAMY